MAVRQVMRQYEQAYNNLDVAETAAIWPSVDMKQLARIFSRLDHQDLHFENCNVVIAEVSATGSCTGWLSYVRRVGDTRPRREHHVWTLEFKRVEDTWQIVQVTAR
jgi:hypothetical protein